MNISFLSLHCLVKYSSILPFSLYLNTHFLFCLLEDVVLRSYCLICIVSYWLLNETSICSKTFADALKSAGVQVKLVLYEGKTHTDLFLQVIDIFSEVAV